MFQTTHSQHRRGRESSRPNIIPRPDKCMSMHALDAHRKLNAYRLKNRKTKNSCTMNAESAVVAQYIGKDQYCCEMALTLPGISRAQQHSETLRCQ